VDEAGCDRLALHDAASGEGRLTGGVPCATRIAWSRASDAVAFWAPRQPLSVLHVASGAMEAVGPADENVGAIGAGDGGAVLWASSSPLYPLTFWTTGPDRRPAPLFEPFHVDPRWASAPTQLSGDGPPIHRHARVCGSADEPGPAIVWLPCAGMPPVPQWNQEAAYLALHGVTTFLVDVPSGPHDSPEVVESKRTAALAVLESIARRPDVAPGSLFLLSCCGASALGYGVASNAAARLRGVIDINGSPGPWIETSLKAAAPAPPVLWITFRRDDAASARSQLAEALSGMGFPITDRTYDTNHTYQDPIPRARLLEDMAAFIRSRSDYTCEDRAAGRQP
jgi:hypothetical protein